MYAQTQGSRRPKLSLAFSSMGEGHAPQLPAERGAPTLSGRELRRIVSEILG